MPKKKSVKKEVVVAKGVKVKRGVEEKMREKKGSSSADKYKNVSKKDFAGKSGGASAFSFPINDLAHARNALARAHFAPNPEGIKEKVYKKFPGLKKRHEERESKSFEKKEHKKDPKPAKKIVKKAKIKKVMHEFKENELHSGSKKGPIVKSKPQALAIALSEAKKAVKKVKPKKKK